jgi:hypothetical protein
MLAAGAWPSGRPLNVDSGRFLRAKAASRTLSEPEADWLIRSADTARSAGAEKESDPLRDIKPNLAMQGLQMLT